MKFLDSGGVTTFWEKIKGKFVEKSDMITALESNGFVHSLSSSGNALSYYSVENNTLGVMGSGQAINFATIEGKSIIGVNSGTDISLSDTYLPLAGGTMNDDATITLQGSNGYVCLSGGDTYFGWPAKASSAKRAIVMHNHSTASVLGIKIYDSYTSGQPGLAISNRFIGFTESDTNFNIDTTATYSTKITPTSISTSDVTASGIVTVNGTTTTITDSGSISISSSGGSVTISSDSNDINLSANGSVNTSDLSVSGGIDCTSTISCKNVTLDALTAAQLKAIATALFDFNSGSYHSAKLIGWDATNKVATITFNINCGNPVTPLKVSYDSNSVGVILPRYTSPYIGAITLAVPLNGSYEYDGTFAYEVDAI